MDTNEVFLAKHPDIPENGIFGKNALAFASISHFENRVVYEGVAIKKVGVVYGDETSSNQNGIQEWLWKEEVK